MFLERLIKLFASLRLTVVILVLAMALVFAGTLAEVHLGLYRAQSEFFRSFFVYWQPQHPAWKIPVFPGGYLIGVLLLINLVAAHSSRFKFSREKNRHLDDPRRADFVARRPAFHGHVRGRKPDAPARR